MLHPAGHPDHPARGKLEFYNTYSAARRPKTAKEKENVSKTMKSHMLTVPGWIWRQQVSDVAGFRAARRLFSSIEAEKEERLRVLTILTDAHPVGRIRSQPASYNKTSRRPHPRSMHCVDSRSRGKHRELSLAFFRSESSREEKTSIPMASQQALGFKQGL